MTDERRTPKRRRRSRRPRRSLEGAVYTEFIIAFPPMLMFFLCLIQLSLLFVGKLSVQHAANRAARAAVVVIPDAPSYYDDEDVNELAWRDGIIGGPMPFGLSLGQDRLSAIRGAASLPLIPISPSVTWFGSGDTVERTFSADYLQIATRGAYALGATSVTFYDEPEGTDLIWTFEPRQEITTRVTYLYHCTIPLASEIMCKKLIPLLFSDWQVAKELLYTRLPIGAGLFAWEGGRFVAIRAETTLPNQGAGYDYH